MCEHVVIEHLPPTRHSKAQSSLHKGSKQVRADQSATTQASRQRWQELVYRRISTARCVDEEITKQLTKLKLV